MIQVIERFHKILETTAKSSGVGVKSCDLAAMLDISQPACNNILRTMIQLGYLKRVKHAKYVLGDTLQRLNSAKLSDEEIVNGAKPEIIKLAHNIGELVILVKDVQGHRRELFMAQGDNILKLNSDLDMHFLDSNLMDTASGMALLAYYSEKQLNEYFGHHSHCDSIAEIQSYKELDNMCCNIRSSGFFASGPTVDQRDEWRPDETVTIGFPVLSSENSTLAAIGIKVPLYRFTAGNFMRIRENVSKACKAIQLNLNIVLPVSDM